MKSNTDEFLMVEIQRGNDKAFSELYDRYSGKMFTFFMRLTNFNKFNSEDFLQELFMKLLSQSEKFKPNYKFSSWFYSCAYNLLKNETRHLKVVKDHLNGISNFQPPFHNQQIEKQMDCKAFIKHLDAFMKNKDLNTKAVFFLKHQMGFKNSEISEVTGIAEGTIKSKLHYLHKQISDTLKPYEHVYR